MTEIGSDRDIPQEKDIKVTEKQPSSTKYLIILQHTRASTMNLKNSHCTAYLAVVKIMSIQHVTCTTNGTSNLWYRVSNRSAVMISSIFPGDILTKIKYALQFF